MHAFVQTALALAAPAAGAFVAATWQGVVLAMVLLLLLRLVPSTSAATRSRLWSGAFLLVVLLHVSPLLFPVGWNGAGSRAASGLAVTGPEVTGPLGTGPCGLLRVGSPWAPGLGCLWLALSCYRAWLLALSATRLRSIARRATALSPELSQTAELQARLSCHSWWQSRGVAICTAICTSNQIDRPCVLGLLAPKILLPPALLADLSLAELEQIVLHEVEHLRRADHWTNLAQKLVLVLFPLNPVLVWIERRLCTERELACDDGVLRQTHAPKTYAGCLARLAEHSLIAQGASLALGAWERQSELSRRVYRILRQPPQPSVRTRRATLATGLLFAGLAAGFVELAQAPSLVTFASVSDPGHAGAMSAQARSAQAHLVNASWSQPPAQRIILDRAARPQTSLRRMSTGRSLASPAQPSRRSALRRSTYAPRPAAATTSVPAREDLARPRLLRVSDGLPNLWPAYAVISVADGWLIFPLDAALHYQLDYQL